MEIFQMIKERGEKNQPKVKYHIQESGIDKILGEFWNKALKLSMCLCL